MSPLVQKRVQGSSLPQRERETRKVQERVFKGGITKGEKLLYMIGLAGIVTMAFFILSNYASLYSLNHDMQQTEQRIVQQQEVNDGLSLQVKELSDPERILYIAQNDLGMKLNDQSVKVIHGND